MIVKYAWSAAGYILISLPVFFPKVRSLAGVGGTAKATITSNIESRDDGLSISQRTESKLPSLPPFSPHHILTSSGSQTTSRIVDCSSPSPTPVVV